MGGFGVCERLGLLSEASAGGTLSFHRFHVRNPIRPFRTGIFLCFNLRRLLFRCRLAGKLEMPSMRRGVFPGGLLSQPSVWWTLFSLRPSQMVRLGDWKYYFATQVPLRAGSNRSPKLFRVLPRPMEKTVASMSNVASMTVVIGVVSAGGFDVVPIRRRIRAPRNLCRQMSPFTSVQRSIVVSLAVM